MERNESWIQEWSQRKAAASAARRAFRLPEPLGFLVALACVVAAALFLPLLHPAVVHGAGGGRSPGAPSRAADARAPASGQARLSRSEPSRGIAVSIRTLVPRKPKPYAPARSARRTPEQRSTPAPRWRQIDEMYASMPVLRFIPRGQFKHGKKHWKWKKQHGRKHKWKGGEDEWEWED